ncbi:tonB-system energizer ExbB [Vibrio harveyi]|uniref:Biopolymer transport protein ExbB n=2 Tax=Vibrio harveyi TaxID=669 RepID=A0A454D5R3_VIBHA|nr:tonB-system energizer ExbB [Vibrio harveyi]
MGMYHAADWVVKGVMLSLLAASILTWAVFLFKQVQLMKATRRTQKLLTELVDAESLENAKQTTQPFKGVESSLISATQHELQLSSLGSASENGIKERVQLRLERVQAELGRSITSLTGILATIGSVGPFVGLFGTVWGIMNAFIGIAKSQNTTLVVVAPGIAEALLATAIGLVAAIPAVVIYNYFTRKISGYKAQLADVSVALMILVSRDLDQKRMQSHQEHNDTVLKKVG